MAETKLKDKNSINNFRDFLNDLGVDAVSQTDEQLESKLQLFNNTVMKSPDESKDTPIDLAYEISINYMDSAIERFDKMDEKIQTIFTFSIGVFAIAPTLLKANTAEKINGLFWAGIGLLILAGVVSIAARIHGELIIANPKKISASGALDGTSENFKRSIVNLAGTAYEKNSCVLKTKHYLNIVSMAIFGIALVILVIWLVNYAM